MISYVKITQPQFPIPTLLPHLGYGSPLELHWSPMRFCLMDPKLQPQWCLVSLGWGNCYFWSNWSPMCEFWVVDWGWLGWARPNRIEFGWRDTQQPQLDSNGPHWVPNGVQLEKWGTVKYSQSGRYQHTKRARASLTKYYCNYETHKIDDLETPGA